MENQHDTPDEPRGAGGPESPAHVAKDEGASDFKSGITSSSPMNPNRMNPKSSRPRPRQRRRLNQRGG